MSVSIPPEVQLAEARQEIINLQAQMQHVIGHIQAEQTAPITSSSRSFGIKPIKPEIFEGLTEKRLHVDTWLFQINQYYDLVKVTDESTRIRYAASLLKGNASLWYQLQCVRSSTSEAFSTWNEFQEALRKQFTPVNWEKRARDQLIDLRQTGSVRRYLEIFTTLCLHIKDLHPTEQLHKFIHGLKPFVRCEVELRSPQTFEDAAAMAEKVDSISFATRGYSGMPLARTKPVFVRSTPPPQAPVPMELDTFKVGRPAKSNEVKGPRLSPEERNRLRDSNSCFYCREPGHIMKFCPLRSKNRGNGRHPFLRA